MLTVLVSLVLVVGYAVAGVGALILAAWWVASRVECHRRRIRLRESSRLLGLAVDRLLGGRA